MSLFKKKDQRPDLNKEKLLQVLAAAEKEAVTAAGKRPKGPNGRVLPTVFRHLIIMDWFRQFTPFERFKIALGFNIVVAIRIPCQHNPGVTPMMAIGEVTDQTKPSEMVREQLESMMKPADVLPVEHEPKAKP